jgi:polysaccharide pyruvyl transferase WcaK-like protein
VGHFAFVVGMRLHFLMFAAMQQVPFVALPYASKVSGFLDALDIEMPPAKQVNAGQLIAYIDRSWDMRNAIQEKIGQALPLLQEQALRTSDIAAHLLIESATKTLDTQHTLPPR